MTIIDYKRDATTPSKSDPLADAKLWLILRHPFFSQAVLEQSFAAEPETVATLSTDGQTIYYNPGFISRLSTEQLAGAIAHELMHQLLFHLCRGHARRRSLWNLATDLAVNNELAAAGLALPPGSVWDPRYDGMDAEQIYALLNRQCPPELDFVTPRGTSIDERDPEQILADHQATAEQLAASHDKWALCVSERSATQWADQLLNGLAQSRGPSGGGGAPGGCLRFAQSLVSGRISWQEELADLLGGYLEPYDFNPGRANFKYLWQSIHLPAFDQRSLPRVVIALDTSASIDQRQLNEFLGELDELLKSVCQARIVTFDTSVYEVRWSAARCGSLGEFSKYPLEGGGGTDFRSLFDYLDDQYEVPDLVIVFTDLQGPFPQAPPIYPVIWTTPGESDSPPFGHLITMRTMT